MSEYSFKLKKGTDCPKTFAVYSLKDGVKTPWDFTGCSAAMQLRQTYFSSKAIDSFTTANGKLVLTDGKIIVNFTHESTTNYPVATLVYDIEITDSEGAVTRPIHGKIKILPEVTKIDPTDK